MKTQEVGTFVDLHNVEFYNLTPRAILHMKCNKKSGLLAISRSDNSIEIWNVASNACVLTKTIYPKSNNIIEGLAWIQGDLLSIDSDGQLLQWDLNLLDVKKVLRVTGSAATCIDVSTDETLIVVGTEEGYVNLFSHTEENGILYNKTMDKQEGRVVCVEFDPSGEYLATGSIDNLRVWNVETGHVLHKMNVPRLEAKKEAIVWCLAFVKDLKIISGDSTGRLTIWDGKLGVQVTSITATKVDILALTVTDDMENVYCSGIDPDIKLYSEVAIRKEAQETRQWVRGKGRMIHHHDVHSLVWYNDKLFSGGQDGFLTVSSYPPKEVNKYGPFLTSPSAVISEKQRLILLKYPNYLEVWRLGMILSRNEARYDDITLKEQPKKLLELNSKNGNSIIDAQISPDGAWIIYNTPLLIKIFRFETSLNGKPELTCIETPKEMMGAQKILFNNKSDTIFISKPNKIIQIFSLRSNAWEYETSIDATRYLKGLIRQISLSSCSKYLAVLSCNGEIVIFQYQKKWEKLLTLPKHSHCPTTMAFRPNNYSIVVAFADQKVFEYDFKEMRFIFNCYADCGNSKHPITGIVFDPRRTDNVLLQTELGIHALRQLEDDGEDLESSLPSSGMKKNKKNNERRDLEGRTVVKTVKEYEHLIHLSWICEKELVAVNINTMQLVEQLPPALKQKKFGIS